MARNRSSEKKQSAPKNDTTHMKSDGKTKRAQDRKNGNKTRGKRARPPGASSKHRSAKTGLKNGAKRDQIVMLQSRTLKQRIRDTQRILALDSLPETVRLTKERILQTLERELTEKETGKREREQEKMASLTPEEQEAASERRRERSAGKRMKREQKKMKIKANVQFFEKRKTIRRLRQSIKSFYYAASDSTRVEFFNLIKTQRGDLNYVHHFPSSGAYISLFPGTHTTSESALKKRAKLWDVINERVIDRELEDTTEKFLDYIIQRTITASQLTEKDPASLKVPHFPALDADEISYLSPAEINEYAVKKSSSEKQSKEEQAKIKARMRAVGTAKRSPDSAPCIEPCTTAMEELAEESASDTTESESVGHTEEIESSKGATSDFSRRVKSKLKIAPVKTTKRRLTKAGDSPRRHARSSKVKPTVARFVAAVDQDSGSEDDPAIKMDDDFFLPSDSR